MSLSPKQIYFGEEFKDINCLSSSSMDIVERLREFLETEARSGSMDFGCVTPLYVYRMWGGRLR